MARWHFCNVLRNGRDTRQFWQFLAANKKFPLQKEEVKLPGEALTAKLFAKDWEHLVQPRLNIAWLPTENVFLRVVQLPRAELEETRSMLDLQLEKLSPMPVAQVVWGYEILPQTSSEMQTAVVVIASRHHVDSVLQGMETIGYFADYVQKTGVWIYTGWGPDLNTCLLAWWQDGVLCHLTLLHLPADQDRASVFQNQLRQMAWTGELEGWLKAEPRFFLVAETEEAEAWKQLFDLDQPVELVPPIPRPELASLTARRVAANSQHTNLLPPEYTARYKQRFVDRLWMRGLGAAIYMIGVAVYFGWVEIAKLKLERVTNQVAALSLAYTNTLQLKAQVQVMRNQVALQFAALDCWKAAADNLPTELTMDNFNFERGRRITYIGLVDQDSVPKVNNQRLFKYVDPPKINPRPPSQSAWSFFCDLEHAETE
jgi:hypothetical protein